jgi:hypothetical protein
LFALATGRANGLHFLGLADDADQLTPGEWADAGARAREFSLPSEFVGLRGFDYTHADGRLAVWRTDAYVSPDDPAYATLPEFYAWLAAQPGALAEFNQPVGEGDFHDFGYDPAAAPNIALLEVGSGAGPSAPYQVCEEEWMRALGAGWRASPTNNTDTRSADWGADTPQR